MLAANLRTLLKTFGHFDVLYTLGWTTVAGLALYVNRISIGSTTRISERVR